MTDVKYPELPEHSVRLMKWEAPHPPQVTICARTLEEYTPEPDSNPYWKDHAPLFTADQMRSYADATCALRGAATAPAEAEVYLCSRPGGAKWPLMAKDVSNETKALFEAEGTTLTPMVAEATATAGGVTEADERAWFESYYASRYGKRPITWNDATRMTSSPLYPLPAHMDGVYVMKDAREGWAAWKACAALTTAARAAEPGTVTLLRDVLAGMEWYCPTSNTSASCPSCGNMKHWGHAEGCELAAALAASPTPPTGTSQGEGTP